jgi:hypothetical protein
MTSCALMCFLMAAVPGQDAPPPLPLSLSHEPAEPAPAAEGFALWRVGARVQIWTAFGTPANDIIGGSLYGSRNLKDLIHEDWWFTLQVYHADFDFERPDEVLFDISAPPTVDAGVSMQLIQFTAEWHPLAKDSVVDLYLGAGFGIVLLSDGDARSLPASDIELEGGAGFELHAVVGAAVRVIGPVYLTAEFSATIIFAGWDGTERVSGRRESLDRWEAAGFSFGIEVRF